MEYEDYSDAVKAYFDDRGTDPLLIAWDNAVDADPGSVQDDVDELLSDRYFTTIIDTVILRGDDRTGILVEVPSTNAPLKEDDEPVGDGVMEGTVRSNLDYLDFGSLGRATATVGAGVYAQSCLEAIPEYFGIEESTRTVWTA